jgi:organic radical activating enzyme
MKYKINEIFYSIQGEGFNVGMPAVFIRFSGCNLKCSYCDTKHANFKEMTFLDIYHQIRKYNCKNVILTGGEPTLQIDQVFIKELKLPGYKVYLETNGTNKIPCRIDYVTVSPKNNRLKQLFGNELKLIYDGQDLKQYESLNFDHFYLQPKFTDNKQETQTNIQNTINIIKRNTKWSLSLQIQKLINIR